VGRGAAGKLARLHVQSCILLHFSRINNRAKCTSSIIRVMISSSISLSWEGKRRQEGGIPRARGRNHSAVQVEG
jgi:hypothetical protein